MSVGRVLCGVLVMWLCGASAAHAASATRWWRFDEADGEALAGAAGKVAVAQDTPGEYIYDPLSGKSSANAASLRVEGNGHLLKTLPRPVGSFTIEAYVKPDGDPRGDVTIVRLASSTGGDDDEASLRTAYLGRWKQTYLGGGYRVPGDKPVAWNAGYYLGSGRIREKDDPGWRHVALVHDADKRTITFYIDHFQHAAQLLDAPLSLPDDAAIHIGGGRQRTGWNGWIDEVRVTDAALPPTKFLRARPTPAADVSFVSEAVVMPPESGYIDLKFAFGAAGDGKTDDTHAFRQAFAHLANKTPLRDYVLYVPPGEYLVSDEMLWTRFLFVQGGGRDRTIIRLKDNCPGYGDASKPKAVLTVGWRPFTPEPSGKAGNNIGSYLHDLTIDTGAGNSGAVGLSYHSNNHGSLTNVTIRSGDGAGWAGLALTDNWPGPSLIDAVTIRGFNHGVYSNIGQYSITFRDLVLLDQQVSGFHNEGQMVFIDGLLSRNRVPAFEGGGIYVITDARLIGGAPDTPAIRLRGGYGLLRNIRVEGYAQVVEHRNKDGDSVERIDGPYLREKVYGRVTANFDSPDRTLSLPTARPPAVPREAPDKWVNILDFEDRKKGDDWAPAVQAAINSGARTLYLPNHETIHVRQPVKLNGKVERLFGLYSGIENHKGYDGPTVIYDQPHSDHVVVIERFRIGHLHHASPGTMIVRDTNPRYTNDAGAGALFAEGTLGHFTITHQDAWFWQLNNEYETPAGRARFENHGGRARIVGMKTEQKGANIMTTNGGMTELLGGYFYANSGTGGQPSIIIDNASFSGTWRNYWAPYKPVVRETRDGQTRGGGEIYQGLYTGHPASSAPPHEFEPYEGRAEDLR